MDRIDQKYILYKLEENDLDQEFENLCINKAKAADINDKIHNIIYDTVFDIKSYISDNSLPMFEKFKYENFFTFIEDQINF
jgi:hypothetical protein